MGALVCHNMTNIDKPVPEGPGFIKSLSTVLLASGMFTTAGILAGKRDALGALSPSDWVTVAGMVTTIANAGVIAAVAMSRSK